MMRPDEHQLHRLAEADDFDEQAAARELRQDADADEAHREARVLGGDSGCRRGG